MKMMSKRATNLCDLRLDRVRSDLQACIKAMKGKYGTRRAISHMEFCLIYIDDLIKNGTFIKTWYQQFRKPPNTPKSRRLGWYEKGEAE